MKKICPFLGKLLLTTWLSWTKKCSYFILCDFFLKERNQKGRDRDLKLSGLEILAEIFFSLKIICWMRIQNICLFSPIQTSIMPQKTPNSEGPGLSYWEKYLKCWHGSRANSVDSCAHSNHSLLFLDLNHYHFYGTHRMLGIDMQTNAPTVATVFIFHVLCKPEFWKTLAI